MRHSADGGPKPRVFWLGTRCKGHKVTQNTACSLTMRAKTWNWTLKGPWG